MISPGMTCVCCLCCGQIAMISPGMTCCEHTLNTLRYADRVKELGPGGPVEGKAAPELQLLGSPGDRNGDIMSGALSPQNSDLYMLRTTNVRHTQLCCINCCEFYIGVMVLSFGEFCECCITAPCDFIQLFVKYVTIYYFLSMLLAAAAADRRRRCRRSC